MSAVYESGWRARAAPIIAKVLEDNRGKTPTEVRRALLAAYPFGPRKYHPYKIWLSEIAIQTGKRKLRWPHSRAKSSRPEISSEDPGQLDLFGEVL